MSAEARERTELQEAGGDRRQDGAREAGGGMMPPAVAAEGLRMSDADWLALLTDIGGEG